MLGWWLPENVSTDGGIFHLLYWSSAVGMLFVQMLFFRLRRPARVRGTRVRGTRVRELVWALVPALLLLSFGVASHRSTNALAAARPQLALETEPAVADGAAR
jgi:heme/copper-type cytochrome/quinol oxidase subunit 2